MTTEPHVVPAEQIYRMVRVLLQRLCKGVCEFVAKWQNRPLNVLRYDDDLDTLGSRTDGQYDPMEADATTGLDSRPVFCFAFASLLRMNAFVRTRGELLAPLWRGICDLAGTLLVVSPADIGWHECLPKAFLTDAMTALGGYLREGKDRLEARAVNLLRAGMATQQHQQNCDDTDQAVAFQGKLVRFMITRISQLMRVYIVLYQNQTRNTEHELLGRKALFEVWRTLLELRGMATVLQLLSSKNCNKHNLGLRVDVSIPKAYFEVAARTGQCVMSFLQGQGQEILVSGLETLLHTDLKELPASSDDTAAQQFREMGRALGKVSILQQVLSFNEGTNEKEIEARLKVVEDLLLTSIPDCFEPCVYSYAALCDDETVSQVKIPTTIIQRSLKQMTRSLRKVPSMHPQLHRLYIRWLAGDCRGKGSVRQHPLARELVVYLLHVHLVECAASSGHGEHVTRLLSYLVKVLFDVRTASVLRGNVAVLLVRLQSSGQVQESARMLMEQEFESWMESVSRHSKKRKRPQQKRQEMVTDPANVSTISWALRGHGMSKRFATEAIHRHVGKAIQQLHGACSNVSAEEQGQHLLVSAERYGLLLAWLERLVVSSNDDGSDCLSWFHQACGIDLSDFVNAVLGAISHFDFQAGASNSRSFKKKVILSNAAMRLSATFGGVASNFDAMSYPIDSMCRLVSCALQTRKGRDKFSFTRYNRGLAFEAIPLLGDLGALVPTAYPERLLEVSEFVNLGQRRETRRLRHSRLILLQSIRHSCRIYVKHLSDYCPAIIGLLLLLQCLHWCRSVAH
jgi:hypothetical protein